MPIIQVPAFLCVKCGYIWLSKQYLEDKKTIPLACAKCKSAYWDRGNTRFTMGPNGKIVEKETITSKSKNKKKNS